LIFEQIGSRENSSGDRVMRGIAATMDARWHAAGLGACALLLAAACGGSSSETPPPLQPDPEGFRYAGIKQPRPPDADSEATEKEEAEEPDETPAKRSRGGQAPSTWGQSGAPETAPKRELK